MMNLLACKRTRGNPTNAWIDRRCIKGLRSSNLVDPGNPSIRAIMDEVLLVRLPRSMPRETVNLVLHELRRDVVANITKTLFPWINGRCLCDAAARLSSSAMTRSAQAWLSLPSGGPRMLAVLDFCRLLSVLEVATRSDMVCQGGMESRTR